MLYLDGNYIAHAEQDTEGLRIPWEDSCGFFTAKCPAFIEGYRVVPEGKTWIREDGAVFTGLMIAPVVNPTILQTLQAVVDDTTITQLDTDVVELTYQNVLLELGL